MDDELTCPLCCEELDLSDQNFLPCKCGYQVCMFCWYRIKENSNGLCPACRTPYADDPHAFAAVDRNEVIKNKKERKQREKEKERKEQLAAAQAIAAARAKPPLVAQLQMQQQQLSQQANGGAPPALARQQSPTLPSRASPLTAPTQPPPVAQPAQPSVPPVLQQSVSGPGLAQQPPPAQPVPTLGSRSVSDGFQLLEESSRFRNFSTLGADASPFAPSPFAPSPFAPQFARQDDEQRQRLAQQRREALRENPLGSLAAAAQQPVSRYNNGVLGNGLSPPPWAMPPPTRPSEFPLNGRASQNGYGSPQRASALGGHGAGLGPPPPLHQKPPTKAVPLFLANDRLFDGWSSASDPLGSSIWSVGYVSRDAGWGSLGSDDTWANPPPQNGSRLPGTATTTSGHGAAHDPLFDSSAMAAAAATSVLSDDPRREDHDLGGRKPPAPSLNYGSFWMHQENDSVWGAPPPRATSTFSGLQ